jgi:hypothetical protein
MRKKNCRDAQCLHRTVKLLSVGITTTIKHDLFMTPGAPGLDHGT